MMKLHDVDQVKQQQFKDGGASLASLNSGFLFMVKFSSQLEKGPLVTSSAFRATTRHH